MTMKTIYDEKNLKGKTIFLRADLNSSLIEGRVVLSPRIREHAKTIYFLSEEGAKTVVLSHQGRPGDHNFVSMDRHASLIKKLIGKDVKFFRWEDNYVEEIKKLNDGEVILLENVRMQPEELEKKTPEEHAKDRYIKGLAPLGDMYVQDALSVCHRSQASVTGFAAYMPCFVGPCLKKDLDALAKLKEIKDHKLLVLGGAKVEDSIPLLKTMLDQKMASQACVGGMFGELFLIAKGVKLGKKEAFFEEKGLLELIPEIKDILSTHGDKITLPIDLAVLNGNNRRKEVKVGELPSEFDTFDIGWDTIEMFKDRIKESELTIFNGPMGMYEDSKFRLGTKKILECIAFNRTFSILGGGDTEKALKMIGLEPSDFDHVSLAGKALLQYLSGKKLPGLEVLESG
ncbi:MAG: phosphoglycerate kinase [Candidatus Diapherotrites archaeon]